MNYRKLSLFFVLFTFLIVSTVFVSADITQRSIPTIYKITGDIDITNPGSYNYFLVTSVNKNNSLYHVSKTACASYAVLQDNLTQGIFVGPIASDVVGYSNKSFNLSLRVLRYGTPAECQNANSSIVVGENVGANFS